MDLFFFLVVNNLFLQEKLSESIVTQKLEADVHQGRSIGIGAESSQENGDKEGTRKKIMDETGKGMTEKETVTKFMEAQVGRQWEGTCGINWEKIGQWEELKKNRARNILK